MRPPTDRDVIPGKWVYKVKLGPSGHFDKFKARYFANGVKQVEGVDYFDFCAYLLTKDIQDSISTISEAKPCDAPVRYQDGFHALSNRERSVSGTATGVCKTRIRWREVSMPT